MSTFYKYRIRCLSEDNWQYWILPSTSPEPTKCPNDTSHNVNTVLTSVIETISENVVTIKEESVQTGGHFGTRTADISISANSTNSIEMWWPYPISATVLKFTTVDAMIGDKICLAIGPDTLIGGLIAPTSSVTAWDSAITYNPGDVVSYLTSNRGTRLFTCLQTADSNQIPGTPFYWQEGFPLRVSSTVLGIAQAGFDLALSNGVTREGLGEVIKVDPVNATVYMDSNPTTTFAPGTYILMTVFYLKDFVIGYGQNYVIGESKIGGSYIPANTKVRITYENRGEETRRIVGSVEYLY